MEGGRGGGGQLAKAGAAERRREKRGEGGRASWRGCLPAAPPGLASGPSSRSIAGLGHVSLRRGGESLLWLSGQGAGGAGRGGASEAGRRVRLAAAVAAGSLCARLCAPPPSPRVLLQTAQMGQEGRAWKWGRGCLKGRGSRGGGRGEVEKRPHSLRPARRLGGDLQGCADFAKLPQESPAGRGRQEEGGLDGAGLNI